MKVFARFSSPTSNSTGDDSVAVAADGSAEAAMRQYKETMRMHRKAMKELHLCAESFIKALESVAKSFQRMAVDTHTPVTIQASGALVRGMEEVRDSILLDDFRDEVDRSLSSRFQALRLEQAALDESRKRKAKADKTLTDMCMQCNKLRHKKDAAFQTASERCDAQSIDCTRLAAEFEDAFRDFAQHMGLLVYTDMTEVSTEIHKLLSTLSYQFRKCEENLKAHPVQRKTTAVRVV